MSQSARKEIAKDLRAVYCANADVLALENLNEFDNIWGNKYPNIKQSWINHWSELSCFYHKSYEILNSTIKRKTKTKGTFAK